MSFEEDLRQEYGNRIIVVGASPERISGRAVIAYREKGFEVYAVNPKRTGEFIGPGRKIPIVALEIVRYADIGNIYVSSTRCLESRYPEKLEKRNVKAVLLNKGTYDGKGDQVIKSFENKGIKVIFPPQSCSIQALGLNPDDIRIGE